MYPWNMDASLWQTVGREMMDQKEGTAQSNNALIRPNIKSIQHTQAENFTAWKFSQCLGQLEVEI